MLRAPSVVIYVPAGSASGWGEKDFYEGDTFLPVQKSHRSFPHAEVIFRENVNCSFSRSQATA